MPPLAYFLGYLLLQTNYERLGLLLLGCCPGGVGSNFWTAMLGGIVTTMESSVNNPHFRRYKFVSDNDILLQYCSFCHDFLLDMVSWNTLSV